MARGRCLAISQPPSSPATAIAWLPISASARPPRAPHRCRCASLSGGRWTSRPSTARWSGRPPEPGRLLSIRLRRRRFLRDRLGGALTRFEGALDRAAIDARQRPVAGEEDIGESALAGIEAILDAAREGLHILVRIADIDSIIAVGDDAPVEGLAIGANSRPEHARILVEPSLGPLNHALRLRVDEGRILAHGQRRGAMIDAAEILTGSRVPGAALAHLRHVRPG